MLLYRTPMGSRLYGLAHPGSDYDWLEVWADALNARDKPRHTHTGAQDVITMSLSTFTRYAARGSHQALEAMFAPPTEVDLFRDFRQSYYCATGPTVSLYHRTIKSFLFGGAGGRKTLAKSYRTALRMTFNLEEILATGRFDPVLLPHRAEWLLTMPEEALREWAEDRLESLMG